MIPRETATRVATTGEELLWSTPAAWARAVLARPLELLSDHAHCELGAAATAQSLITRRPDSERLVDGLARLAAEEMRHFRRVHALLVDLGGRLGATRKNPYAEGLVRRIPRRSPDALLDRLLVAALIERRSHERFELLAAEARAAHPRLADLFGELGPAERAHAHLFTELALELFPGADHPRRQAEWASIESELLRGLPFEHRLHAGPPPAGAGGAP